LHPHRFQLLVVLAQGFQLNVRFEEGAVVECADGLAGLRFEFFQVGPRMRWNFKNLAWSATGAMVNRIISRSRGWNRRRRRSWNRGFSDRLYRVNILHNACLDFWLEHGEKLSQDSLIKVRKRSGDNLDLIGIQKKHT
jgi:hypothetical protein